jgi:hypothetical protein
MRDVMAISAQDVLNAALLADAAYDKDSNGQPRTAQQALAGTGWQLVDLAFFEGQGITTLDADDFVDGYFTVDGYSSNDNQQALVAYRVYDGHAELAISFRGTDEFGDFIDDAIGGGFGWGLIHDSYDLLIDAVLDLWGSPGSQQAPDHRP